MPRTWVKCKNSDGEPVYLNMANAFLLTRARGLTRVAFVGDADSHVDVREEPEEILKLLDP